MKRPRLITVASASLLVGGAPAAASALVAECDRHDTTCSPRVPHTDDNHAEYVIAATGTGSNILMGTGSSSAAGTPPSRTAGKAAAMDTVVPPLPYPEFLGVQPRVITTGTQEGPSLW